MHPRKQASQKTKIPTQPCLINYLQPEVFEGSCPRGSGLVIASLFLCWCISASAQTPGERNIPHLEHRGKITRLIVDGKPFLILGSELYNNSATSVEYRKPIWPRLQAMRI
jgi:hypothetical protein